MKGRVRRHRESPPVVPVPVALATVGCSVPDGYEPEDTTLGETLSLSAVGTLTCKGKRPCRGNVRNDRSLLTIGVRKGRDFKGPNPLVRRDPHSLTDCRLAVPFQNQQVSGRGRTCTRVTTRPVSWCRTVVGVCPGCPLLRVTPPTLRGSPWSDRTGVPYPGPVSTLSTGDDPLVQTE